MKLLQDVSLASHTSLKAGGKAEKLIELEKGDSLTEVLKENKGPVWVLGFGTNCLISDKGLAGTVILNKVGGVHKLGSTTFKADSGANWDELVESAIKQGLWGLEFTSGIPGGVGAAVAGNIAAYGHKVADSLIEATILNTANGSIEKWDKTKFGFDYRTSVLQRPENKSLIVLDATFALSPTPDSELEYESALAIGRELGLTPDSLANRRKIIMETRRRAGSLLNNLSDGPWTAGSFFKNPMINEEQVQTIIDHEEKSVDRDQLLRQNLIHGQNKARVSAAHVLLAAGFNRGQTWGSVRLNPDHILKIENTGNAKAQDIYDVVQTIVSTVKQKLGIELEPEVRFLGDF